MNCMKYMSVSVFAFKCRVLCLLFQCFTTFCNVTKIGQWMGVKKLFLIFTFVCKVAESDSFILSFHLT
jgi:hypothetical protein